MWSSHLGGYGEPYLHGIGTDFTQPNADASVATYIDGAYVASDQAIITNLLGVERVEVLEGPQGTLYGRNATGGAINIITLTPEATTSAQFSAGGGDYNRREVAGHLSGAVSDTLGARCAAHVRWHRDVQLRLTAVVLTTRS